MSKLATNDKDQPAKPTEEVKKTPEPPVDPRVLLLGGATDCYYSNTKKNPRLSIIELTGTCFVKVKGSSKGRA